MAYGIKIKTSAGELEAWNVRSANLTSRLTVGSPGASGAVSLPQGTINGGYIHCLAKRYGNPCPLPRLDWDESSKSMTWTVVSVQPTVLIFKTFEF